MRRRNVLGVKDPAARPRRFYRLTFSVWADGGGPLKFLNRPLSWSVGAALALWAGAGPAAAPAAPAALATPETAKGWPTYGGEPGGGHYSAADRIGPENVSQLEIAWRHNSGDLRQRDFEAGVFSQSSFQATPILIDETLYYCSPFNLVFALNARTGAERWRFDPEVDKGADLLPNCRDVSSWRSGKAGFCEHRIIEGTLDGRLIALDGATGKPCPDFGTNGEVDVSHGLSKHAPRDYSITSPPAILNDLAITGAMVLDNVSLDVPSGVVRAYDVRTGALRWAWNPVPPGMAGRDEDGSYRRGTTNVWSIISVDAERNLVFVPTGNTSPDYFGGLRNGLDAYSSSVVALDGATGKRIWHYQTVHHDIWDYDVPAQPTLLDLRLGEGTVAAVAQVTKMGLTFVLNRENGHPVWPVEERPVPQAPVAGETLSPTQPFPSHLPALINTPITPEDAWGFTFWDRGSCREQIAQLRNEGIYTPPSVAGTLFHPSNAGGNNWGSPAIDPQRQTLFVVTNRIPGILKLRPRAECRRQGSGAQLGTPYCVSTPNLISPLGVPCTAPPWSTLDAIDLVEGRILWSAPLGTSRHMAPFPFWWIKGVPAVGGPAATASGLIFIGAAMDHYFRAFDARTGAELWRHELPTAANSTPMTYQLPGGRQFVVTAAGGHWAGYNPPGDHLVAFALPEGEG